jgi:anti-sigma regulatory factor (Ser/Thr protein kinase)
MPVRQHALRFPGRPEDFSRAAADLRALLDECAVHGRARYQVELVFEEVVMNVIRHGYTDDRAHEIDVTLTRGDDVIVLTFDDDGRPFDPLQQPAPVRPTSVQDAPSGGRGIVLLRNAARDLRYMRTADHKNRLTVTIAT